MVKAEKDKKFEDWWDLYGTLFPRCPRMKDKKKCAALWKRKQYGSQLDKISTWTKAQKLTEEWTKDAGQYQPMPFTILHNERWMDNPEALSVAPKEAPVDAANRPWTPQEFSAVREFTKKGGGKGYSPEEWEKFIVGYRSEMGS